MKRRISFKVIPEDSTLIHQITDRAMTKTWFSNLYKQGLDLIMDLSATHENGCRLNLQKLLDAPDFDFFHDIRGIHHCLNRETGELADFFLPRCARP